MANTHTYTKPEERANAITHGIGAGLSIAALTILITYSFQQGTTVHILSSIIYGVSMLLLYLCSTLVHSFPEGKVKDLFELLDHASIYLFIAGTYTPVLLLLIKGTLGWTLLSVVWGLALLGIVFKIFFVKKFLFISTFIYILMGWLVVTAWGPLSSALPSNGLTLLVAGGIAYTVGTIFYMWRSFRFHHAVWHLFVLGGSALHFFAVLLYILPA
jgi:hemolysin III